MSQISIVYLSIGFHLAIIGDANQEFEPNLINYDLTDADVDAESSDSSFWAASAYANGSVWEPASIASTAARN